MGNKNIENQAVRIKSIQANSLYLYQNNIQYKDKNGQMKDAYINFSSAYLNGSLFLRYMKKHGLVIPKANFTDDFIIMKFDYDAEKVIDEKKVVVKKKEELREYYYQNGATIEKYNNKTKETKSITYRMLMRSTGAAKEGKCVFVKKELYDKAIKFITMGLNELMPEDNVMLVELGAYSTLVTATAKDYINIPINSIFVVKDQEVSTYKKALKVKVQDVEYDSEALDYDKTEIFINEHGITFYKKKADKLGLKYIKKSKSALEENGISLRECPHKTINKKECCVEEDENAEIKNTLWDGEGIIDDSIFPDDMDGFIYCRSHFFKSCLFRGSIQKYFKDVYGSNYENMVLIDMFGRKIKAKDIKVIITDNSIKWIKFKNLMGKTDKMAFNYWKSIMDKYDDTFSIVKTGHKSRYGELQRMSYQMLNSLPTTDKDVLGNIAQESMDYLRALKTDNEAFIDHLKITSNGDYKKENILIVLSEWNARFRYTKIYKKARDKILNELKEKMQRGKLMQQGSNLTICGNPLALLMAATGENYLAEGCFQNLDDGIECYTERFADGEMLAAFRSPHNAPNNVAYLVNVYPEKLRKYFSKLGESVIVINGIGTDVQSRLNGSDTDSDFVFVTAQKDIVELAKKAYKEYPTIVNAIQSNKQTYKNNVLSYAEIDNKIAGYQMVIGQSSDMAQLALSYYYNCSAEDADKKKQLRDIFVIGSVLAQLAIDSAKKTFELEDPAAELKRLKKLECMEKGKDGTPLYPIFLAEEKNSDAKRKRRKAIKEENTKRFNCPMDIIYEAIGEKDEYGGGKHRDYESADIKEVLKYDFNDDDLALLAKKPRMNSKQYEKIKKLIESYVKKIKKADKTEDISNEFNQLQERTRNIKIKDPAMYALIKCALGEKNVRREKHFKHGIQLLNFLYVKTKKDNDGSPWEFLKMFKKTPKSSQKVSENA